ncbi:hypothetical protein NKR23_g12333 [Pleurostoma richardsiae]|uniref:Protein kinase domain-containing protein n=1 Tax=Pleurostoma richardsiae TaxID=41990 RepID=A0AA38RGG9_9PEZI|nr:hypothetical protein NKR23_g12333 [Pleurostoma richardsiae]
MPPVFLNRNPKADFDQVGTSPHGWIALHQARTSRQIVLVRDHPDATISDVGLVAKVAHVNIARILGVYFEKHSVYVVHEFLDLDLFEVFPLASEVEVASVMSQIISAIIYLASFPIILRVDTIRISFHGVVKLGIDMNYKPTTGSLTREADRAFLTAYAGETMMRLGGVTSWTQEAMDFLSILQSGSLPALAHPFLLKSKGSLALREPVKFAIQKLIAAG